MPSQQIDVYRDWLKIADANRPLDHYQILRLPRFTDDLSKVRAHHHKMVEHVRGKYGEGDTAAQAKELIDELTRAMLVLTDLAEKEPYDARLGRKDSAGAQRKSMHDLLLASKAITEEQLAKAEKFASVTGFELHDALIQQKLATPDVVMQAFADSEGLPFIDLRDVPLDESLLPYVPAALARQHSIVPVLSTPEHILVAGVKLIDHDVEDQLRLRFDKKIRQALCAPAGLNEAISKYYPRDAAVKEMSGAAPTPTMKSGGTGEAAAAAPAGKGDAADRAERKKIRVQYTLIALAFGFIAVMVVGSLMGWTATTGALIRMALVGVVVGGISAGVTWLANS